MQEKKKEEKDVLKIKYINIEGLSLDKMIELQEMIEENCILLITETRLNYDKYVHANGLMKIENHRETSDKNGGGIMILYKADNNIKIVPRNRKHPDLLTVEINIGNIVMTLITLYLSIVYNEKDRARNNKIIELVEQEITDTVPVMIIGDFNGHLADLGYQREDENGKRLEQFIERNDLILISLRER